MACPHGSQPVAPGRSEELRLQAARQSFEVGQNRREAIAVALVRLARRLPEFEAAAILDRALASPGLRGAVPETAARLALISYARHVFTDYDDLLADGYDRDSARHFVLGDLNETLIGWGAPPVPEEDPADGPGTSAAP